MVKDWLLEWFEKNGRIKKEELNLADNYIDMEYIDSFGFISLLSECEEHFNISFSDNDFADEKILTIDGMIQDITNKLENI